MIFTIQKPLDTIACDYLRAVGTWRRMNCDENSRDFTRLLWSDLRMLKLTKKADYALMAMKHLAERSEQGALSAKDVADAYSIPPEALAKILQRLAKAGLLHSQHGINGGYMLARAAHTISAFEVIQAIDGPLFITSCVTVRGECDQTDRCNIREPLRKVNDSIEAVLKRIKISHMREEPEESTAEVAKPGELVTIT
jgi:Rrf2 family protein